ncbi:MAG: zf-TFIIB domain-containing protein [Planctomycetota bacterium]
MKCPVCVTPDLKITDRAGVEIDYCPECRGIWLDRGELDKIMDRAAGDDLAQRRRYDDRDSRDRDRDRGRRYDDDSFDYSPKEWRKRYKKRKPWWVEIFD